MSNNISINEIPDLKLTDYLKTDFNKLIYDKFHRIDKHIINETFDFKKFFEELYKVLNIVNDNILIKDDLIEYLKEYFLNLKQGTLIEIYYKKKFINVLTGLIEKTFAFVVVDGKEFSKFNNIIFSDPLLKSFMEIIRFLNSIDYEIRTPESLFKRINDFMREYSVVNNIKAYRSEDMSKVIFSNDSLYHGDTFNVNIVDLHSFIENNFFKIKYPNVENKENIIAPPLFEELLFKPKFNTKEIGLLTEVLHKEFDFPNKQDKKVISEGMSTIFQYKSSSINQAIKNMELGYNYLNADDETKKGLITKLELIINVLKNE